ncbi:MAG TPA: hypothetical protein DEA44_16860 [Firmicutes bacterium]|nr:hypothetical protein [Bacillota bacterium]
MADAPYIASCERWGYEYPAEPKGHCFHCGGDLFAGSYVAEINGQMYCEACLGKMQLYELLALFDVTLEEVKC